MANANFNYYDPNDRRILDLQQRGRKGVGAPGVQSYGDKDTDGPFGVTVRDGNWRFRTDESPEGKPGGYIEQVDRNGVWHEVHEAPVTLKTWGLENATGAVGTGPDARDRFERARRNVLLDQRTAPDRTEADRMARAISDAGGTDNGTVGRDANWAAQNFAARNGARREDAPRFANLHDYDYERSFGSAAAERAIASGMSRTPTFDQSFGTPAQREAANERIAGMRLDYLDGQAGNLALSPAARKSFADQAAALRLQRAQANEQDFMRRMQGDRIEGENYRADAEWGARTAIGDRTARAQEYAAEQQRLGQVGAAKAEERWRKAETEGANGRAATEWGARTAIGERAAQAQENVATTQGVATLGAATAQANAQRDVGLAEAGRPAWSPNGRAVATTGENWSVTQTEQPPAPEPQTGRYAMGKDGTIYDTTTGQRAEGLSEAQTIDIQLGELRKPPTGYVSKEDLAFRQNQIEALEKRKKELEERARSGGAAPAAAGGWAPVWTPPR